MATVPTVRNSSIVDEMRAEDRARAARMASLAAPAVSPDAMASALNVATDTGAPVLAVADNLPEFEQQRTLDRLQAISQDSPALGNWLSDPVNAKLAEDDLDTLTGMETALSGWLRGDWARAIGGGVVGDTAGMGASGTGTLLEIAGRRWGQFQRGGDPTSVSNQVLEQLGVFGPADVAQSTGVGIQDVGDSVQAFGEFIKPPTERRNLATDTMTGLGQVAGQVGLTAVAPWMAGVTMAGQGAEIQRDRAAAAGATQDQADLTAVAGAGWTALTEAVGIGYLMRRLPKAAQDTLKKRGVDMILSGLGEGTQEVTEGVGGDMLARATYDPNAVIGAGAAKDFTVAGLVGTIARGVAHIRPRARVLAASEESAATMEALHDLAQKSKTGGRAASRLQDFIAQAGPDMEAFTDAEAFVKLFQSPAEAHAAAAEATGNPDALLIALASKADIGLPIGPVVAKLLASPIGEAYMKASKLAPGLRTTGEQRSADPEADVYGLLDEVRAAMDAARKPAENQGPAFDAIMPYLMQTGRLDEGQATAYAGLYQRAMDRIAKDTGQTVEDVIAQNPVEVWSSTVGDRLARTNPQGVPTSVATILAAMRTGKLPTDRDIYGPSLVDMLVKAGGLQDSGGELRAMDARLARPGLVSMAGLTFDEALTRARAAGYLPPSDNDGVDTLGVNDLIDAIRDDLSEGGKFAIYGEADAKLLKFREDVREWERELPGVLEDGEAMTDLLALPDAQIIDRVNRAGSGALEQASQPGGVLNPLKFSLQKIGTGEGAQAYGWGIYFAGQKKLGEFYREKLSGQRATLSIDGVAYDGNRNALDGANMLIADAWNSIGKGPKSKKLLIAELKSRKKGAFKEWRGRFDEAIAKVGSEAVLVEAPQGQLYSAEIPEDSDLLDYDKPLSEQPEKVRAAMESLKGTPAWRYLVEQQFGGPVMEQATGRDLYLALAGTLNITDPGPASGEQKASHALYQAGIPGLRYLDGNSRNAGTGSHNYVIWDEGAIQDVQTFYQSQTPQTETEAFKRWFGDNGAVDENGDPQIFYHGGDESFSMVKDKGRFGGIFAREGSPSGYRSTQFALYLNQPVLEISELADILSEPEGRAALDRAAKREHSEEELDLLTEALTDGSHYPSDETIWELIGAIDEGDAQIEIQALRGRVAKELGRAAVRTPDEFDGETVMIVDPYAIKSATGNNGDFDPNNPSILKQKERGSIEFRPNQQGGITSLIRMMEDANASTLLHEFGHLYLEILDRNSAASPALARDMDKLLNWWGVTREQWAGWGLEQRREYHELFARGFEAYLAEGKAPAKGLKGVMRRFKAWIVQSYRDLKDLNVTINDDVRSVFDRMLASDEEIEAQRDALSMAPALPVEDARKLGMSEHAIGLYARAIELAKESLTAKVLRAKFRENKAWYKAQIAVMEAQVRAEADEMPVYRAIAAIQSKAVPKLSGEELNRRYPGGFAQTNLLKHRVYSAKGGESVDMVAGLLGFPSGDALVQAMASADPVNQYVKAEAENRVRERHGDPMTDGTIQQQAQAALHNSRMATALEAEIELLSELAKEPPPKPGAIREAARRIIAGVTVRKLNPNQHLVAERKAARLAAEFAGKGKYSEALAAKRAQAINAALYSEATKAQQDARRLERVAKQLAKQPAQKRLAAAREDWRQIVNTVLDSIGVRKIGSAGRLPLRPWLVAHTAKGNEAPITDGVAERADAGGIIGMRDLTVADAREVLASLRATSRQATLANTVIRDGQRVEWEITKAELMQKLAETQGEGDSTKLRDDEYRGLRAALEVSKSYADMMLSTQTIIERLDGGERGIWHEVLWDIGSDARTAQAKLRRAILTPLADLVGSWDKPALGRLAESFDVPALGLTMTRQNLIAVLLNLGTNRRQLQEGGQIVNGKLVLFSDEAIDQIVAKATREDWAIARTVWTALESLKQPTVELQKRMGGIMAEMLVPDVIQTPFGPVQGGYFPAMADPLQSAVGQKMEAADTVREAMATIGKASTSKSRTKERTGAVYPLNLNLESVLTRGVDDAITDITHREFLLQAQKIVNDPNITSAMINRMGPQVHASLKAAIDRPIKRVMGDRATRELSAGMDNMMLNLTSMALGWRFALGAANYATGWVQAAARVKSRNLARALYATSGWNDFPKAQATVYALSPYMETRDGGLDAAYLDAAKQIAGKQTIRAKAIRMGMAYARHADRLASVPIWLARFNQARDAGEPVDIAVRLADTAVQQTQTDSDAFSLSAFEGDKPQFKLFKMFLGPMVIQQNRIRDAFAGKGGSRSQSVPERMGVLLAAWVVPAMLFEILVGRGPDDGDDDELQWDEVGKWAAAKVGLFPFMTVPFVRDVASAMEAKMLDRPVFARNNPISDAGLSMLKLGDEFWDAAFADEEMDAEQLVKAAGKSAGMMTGFPYSATSTAGDFIYDVGTGEYEPAGPQDLRYLIVRRQE